MKKLKQTISIVLTLFMLLINYACTDLLIDDEGKKDEDIYLNYEIKTDLALPFNEEWYIAGAGRDHENGLHHFVSRGVGQRYAIDAYIKVDGSTYSRDGKENEDYYCFGKTLIAPAEGKVVGVVNHEDDIAPGANYDGDNAAGNYVIIDHLNGEYSQVAHFMKGTIVVNVGENVVKGQELGKSGNSGSSTEPRLHYHIQNSPKSTSGLGLPITFKKYYVDDVFVESGGLVKGQYVKN